jgi:hypothetical protein
MPDEVVSEQGTIDEKSTYINQGKTGKHFSSEICSGFALIQFCGTHIPRKQREEYTLTPFLNS